MKTPEEKYLLIDVFADNGEHSHYALIERSTGVKVWSEDPEECRAQGHPVKELDNEELDKDRPDDSWIHDIDMGARG